MSGLPVNDGYSHQEIYRRLGCPNLAILQLDMTRNASQKLEISKPYSFLSLRWAERALYLPRLARITRCGKSIEWLHASGGQRFSMVVQDCCDSLQFQQKILQPTSTGLEEQLASDSSNTSTAQALSSYSHPPSALHYDRQGLWFPASPLGEEQHESVLPDPPDIAFYLPPSQTQVVMPSPWLHVTPSQENIPQEEQMRQYVK